MKSFAIKIFVVLLGLFGLISVLLYHQLWNYTIETQKQDIQNLIKMEEAIRHYVDGELKPELFKLQAQHLISNQIYTPKIFSTTYITSHIFDAYIKQRQFGQSHKGVVYRVASDNPLNLHNLTTAEELKTLKRFRKNPALTHIEGIKQVQGKSILFYQRPVEPNTAACLLCHGQPKLAPKGLIKLYGHTHGFNEQVGLIRGFSSYHLDLTDALTKMKSFYGKIEGLILFAFMVLYFVILQLYRYFKKTQKAIEQQKQALDQLANQDALTGLANRHKLEADLSRSLAHLAEGKLTGLLAIMIDIDFFKTFNDQYGHDIGDIVLQGLAKHLTPCCTVFPTCLYRLGGEEFLILVENCSEQERHEVLMQLCERLTFHVDSVNEEVSLSMGVAQAEKMDTQKTLLKKADLALYYVKEHGRKNIHVFGEDTI